jgi:hypothetical protein
MQNSVQDNANGVPYHNGPTYAHYPLLTPFWCLLSPHSITVAAMTQFTVLTHFGVWGLGYLLQCYSTVSM